MSPEPLESRKCFPLSTHIHVEQSRVREDLRAPTKPPGTLGEHDESYNLFGFAYPEKIYNIPEEISRQYEIPRKKISNDKENREYTLEESLSPVTSLIILIVLIVINAHIMH